MMKDKRSVVLQIGVAVALIAIGIAGRLLPHETNVTPVAAAALFAGFFFGRAWVAMAVPLVTLVISDALIGGYEPAIMAAVYLGMLAPLLLRPLLRRHLAVWSVAASTAASSVLFFAISNLAVWAFSGMYPRTGSGLVECYTLALPFLRNTLSGDALWSLAFFGGYAVCAALAQARTNRPIASIAR